MPGDLPHVCLFLVFDYRVDIIGILIRWRLQLGLFVVSDVRSFCIVENRLTGFLSTSIGDVYLLNAIEDVALIERCPLGKLCS